MVNKRTPQIRFQLNTTPAIDFNLSDELTIHLLIGKDIVLKFKLGGGVGYDGDVSIDVVNTNLCWCTVTPDMSDKITCGKFIAEFYCLIDFPGFPAGRIFREKVELTNYNTPATIHP